MRFVSGILLILIGVFMVLSLVTHDPTDIFPGESFISPPRHMNNIMGPLGAWFAMKTIGLAGYLGFLLAAVVILIGVGRLLLWNTKKIVIQCLYVFGWLFAISILVGGLAGQKASIFAGKLGEVMASILGKLGSFGGAVVAILVFVAWFLWATKIGFSRLTKLLPKKPAPRKTLPETHVSERVKAKFQRRKSMLDEFIKRQEVLRARRRPAVETFDYFSDEIFVVGRETQPPAKEEFTIDESPPGIPDIVPEISVSQPREKNLDTHEPHRKPQGKPETTTVNGLEIYIPGLLDILGGTSKPGEKHEEEIAEIPRIEPEHKKAEKIAAETESKVLREETVQPVGPKPEVPATAEDKLVKPREAHESPRETPAIIQKEKPITKAEKEPVTETTESTVKESIEPEITVQKPKEEELEPTVGTLINLSKVPFEFPPLSILTPPPIGPAMIPQSELASMAEKIKSALETYKISGRIVAVKPGPIITRFEFEPVSGTRVSRIVALEDDLALALKAQNVRIVAPLPGKGTVGIEIPNPKPNIVYIRSVLESPQFRNTKAKLPLALGMDVSGTPVVEDLTEMPHLLIAGATGSGKSVCINSIITSFAYKLTPMDLRLLLIDPKRIELSIYNDIPYLIAPVVVDNKEAAAALNWAISEMEARYKVLSAHKVRNIAEYNNLIQQKPYLGNKMPYLVIIIDELADLMMTVANEVEEPIARLAQMARAVGIHLVIATQRPSVDVVTGIIKANFPTRIAFKVRSKIDSRTILDLQGAERLLGRGDMLYLSFRLAEPIRIHGSFISTQETTELVSFLKKYPNPQSEVISFKEELAKRQVLSELDELFWEAAKIVVISQKGSASHLQRKLRIGYTRAASIIDQLEMMGIVGPFEGSKAREVYVETLEELDRIRKEFEARK